MPRARARQSMRRVRNGSRIAPRTGGQPGRASRRDAQVHATPPCRRARHRDANRGVVRSESGRHGSIRNGMRGRFDSRGRSCALQREWPWRPARVEVWHSRDASRCGAAARIDRAIPYRLAAARRRSTSRCRLHACRGTRASVALDPRRTSVFSMRHTPRSTVVGVHELAHLAVERGALGSAGRRLVCRYSCRTRQRETRVVRLPMFLE